MPSFEETPEQALANVLNKDVTLYLEPPSGAGYTEVLMEGRLNLSNSIVSLKVLQKFNWKAAATAEPPKFKPKKGDKIELSVCPGQASEEVVLEFDVVDDVKHIVPDARCSIIAGASACRVLIEQWRDEHRADLLLLESHSKVAPKPGCFVFSMVGMEVPVDGFGKIAKVY